MRTHVGTIRIAIVTQIVYDREERSQLAVQQGAYAEEHFIKPYESILQKWSDAVTVKTNVSFKLLQSL